MRIAILVPPIIQLFVFTFAATLDVKDVSIGILNRDPGELSFQFIERFYGTQVFKKIEFLKTIDEVAPFIDRQKGLMVVMINDQFSRNLNAKKPAQIQLIFDGRKSNTAQIVSGYTTEIIKQFQNDYLANTEQSIENIKIIPRTWFNPNRLYYWYNIPCLVGILSMLICLVITTQSVARERELGTFDQLLVSPFLPYEIILGKVIPGILIGFFEGLLMLAAGTLLLGVPFHGSLILFFFSLLIFVCSISGIGLFISALSSTQQQAMLGTFIFMLPSVLLSGYATPIENMPTWLQPVTAIIPLKYMLVISKGLFLKATPWKIVFANLWPLIVIALVNLVGAGLFFRRRIQ